MIILSYKNKIALCCFLSKSNFNQYMVVGMACAIRSLSPCVFVCLGMTDREDSDSLILNVTGFAEVNALSHFISFTYEINVSVPLSPGIDRSPQNCHKNKYVFFFFFLNVR